MHRAYVHDVRIFHFSSGGAAKAVIVHIQFAAMPWVIFGE